jgi:hypothetical protein
MQLFPDSGRIKASDVVQILSDLKRSPSKKKDGREISQEKTITLFAWYHTATRHLRQVVHLVTRDFSLPWIIYAISKKLRGSSRKNRVKHSTRFRLN